MDVQETLMEQPGTTDESGDIVSVGCEAKLIIRCMSACSLCVHASAYETLSGCLVYPIRALKPFSVLQSLNCLPFLVLKRQPCQQTITPRLHLSCHNNC